MREKIVAGNWKMNKTLPEAKELVSNILQELKKNSANGVKTIIAPPYPFLLELKTRTEGADIYVAAQNCHHEDKGAFTGEVSPAMIRSVGAELVILGHSERREQFNETDEIIAQKVAAALKNDVSVIFCCGETLEQRKSGSFKEIIQKQISKGLFNLSADQFEKIIVAYEPVWAIGTGETATPEQAQEIHAFIRGVIAEKYSNGIADELSILYGGSCKPGNAASLFAQPDIDGGLIGGASLKAEDFVAIVHSF